MKRTKKPVVQRARKFETVIYELAVDLEYDLKTVITKLQTVIKDIEESVGSELHKEPHIDYDYYGYDGGKDINIVYEKYIESEDGWKSRVEAEEKALKDWEEDITNQRILKLEQELKELKGGN